MHTLKMYSKISHRTDVCMIPFVLLSAVTFTLKRLVDASKQVEPS